MNRVAKLLCWFLIVEMIVVGFGAISSRWDDILHHPHAISAFGWRIVFALFASPVLAVYGVFRTERRLRRKGIEFSAGQREVTGTWMVASFIMVASMQNWFAAILAKHQMLMLLNTSPQPVAMLVGGALLILFGNASAKFAPPTGPAAPDPGAWIRASLRSGWTAVLSGIAFMAAAFAPMGVRAVVLLVVMAAMIANRGLLRDGPGPRAQA
jgi:hypothetical protein